jgi:uncharacterized protein YdaU (DUF1376 family)
MGIDGHSIYILRGLFRRRKVLCQYEVLIDVYKDLFMLLPSSSGQRLATVGSPATAFTGWTLAFSQELSLAEFPALPIFTDAYLGDTRHLTAAQHGAYLLLLMTAWRTPDCALPDDDKILCRYAAMDLRTWQRNRSVVMSFWKLGEDQKFRQGRLTDERFFADDIRNKRAQAGHASALKRKGRHAANEPTKDQHVLHYPLPSPLPTPTDIKNTKGNGHDKAKPTGASEGQRIADKILRGETVGG